jgi:hypothetical protein
MQNNICKFGGWALCLASLFLLILLRKLDLLVVSLPLSLLLSYPFRVGKMTVTETLRKG